MKESFEKFLATGQQYSQLSEALYAYESLESLCINERKLQKDQGTKCFKIALNFITILHEELGKKQALFQGDTAIANLRSRFGELRLFFSRHVFSDFLIAFITHLGGGQMAKFVEERLIGLELREFSGVLTDLGRQKGTVRTVRGKHSLIQKSGGKIHFFSKQRQ
jgi:hypothetical protein